MQKGSVRRARDDPEYDASREDVSAIPTPIGDRGESKMTPVAAIRRDKDAALYKIIIELGYKGIAKDLRDCGIEKP
jgi:hypothetical protein